MPIIPRKHLVNGSIAALLAWMLGYGMGGGFHIHGKGEIRDGDNLSASSKAGSWQTSNPRLSTEHLAVDTLEDQIAGRRGKWTQKQLCSSLNSFSHEPDTIHAFRSALKLTEQLESDDFPMAIEAGKDSANSLGELGEVYMALAMERWADLNPQAVGEYLKGNMELIKNSPDLLVYVLSSWATKNPMAAIAWAKSLPENRNQERGIRVAIVAVARNDLDEALSLMMAHAPSLLQDDTFGDAIDYASGHFDRENTARKLAEFGGSAALRSAAQKWAHENPVEALKWAENLPNSEQREEALKGVWPEFAAEHPEDAAAKLAQGAADILSAKENVKVVAATLARKDPQTAERWVATLPEGKVREEAYASIAEFYGQNNPALGGQWLDRLAEGTERDLAVGAYVAQVRREDPVAATDWAVTIRDESQRLNAVRWALFDWFRQSPGAAMEWLKTTPSISEENRQEILSKL